MRAAALAVLLVSLALAGCSTPPPPGGSPPGGAPPSPPAGTTAPAGDVNVVYDTTMGSFTVTLYLGKAPITAGNFLNLTSSGFYNGTRFHRVIEGFMIQDGDPLTKDPAQSARWGTGGPGYTIPDEFPCKDGTVSYEHPARCPSGLLFTHEGEGILSMANTGRPRTGGSQYFITVGAPTHLDGKHAIFGKVASGMEVVRAINQVETAEGDRPVTDVVIRSIRVAGS